MPGIMWTHHLLVKLATSEPRPRAARLVFAFALIFGEGAVGNKLPTTLLTRHSRSQQGPDRAGSPATAGRAIACAPAAVHVHQPTRFDTAALKGNPQLVLSSLGTTAPGYDRRRQRTISAFWLCSPALGSRDD